MENPAADAPAQGAAKQGATPRKQGATKGKQGKAKAGQAKKGARAASKAKGHEAPDAEPQGGKAEPKQPTRERYRGD